MKRIKHLASLVQSNTYTTVCGRAAISRMVAQTKGEFDETGDFSVQCHFCKTSDYYLSLTSATTKSYAYTMLVPNKVTSSSVVEITNL